MGCCVVVLGGYSRRGECAGGSGRVGRGGCGRDDAEGRVFGAHLND